MSKMKKFFFLFLMLLTLSSTSFSKNTEVMQADKPNLTVSADNEKKSLSQRSLGYVLLFLKSHAVMYFSLWIVVIWSV